MDRQQLAADNALRNLPSHGWTAGWTGRRDRALIVLSQVADLPYQRIARLSAGDISFADGAATIDGPDGATTVAPSSNGLLCAPCALARWLHALDLTVVYADTSVIASVIGRAAPLTAQSPHVCQNPQQINAATRDVPALPTIDAWGILAPQRLSNRPHPRPYLTQPGRPPRSTPPRHRRRRQLAKSGTVSVPVARIPPIADSSAQVGLITAPGSRRSHPASM